MKRRLTFLFGSTSMATTVDADDADRVLYAWQAYVRGEPSADAFITVAGTPVMHIALGAVAAITDEIE